MSIPHPLYAHQKSAVRTLIKNPRFALYHEQGLGKTVTSIIAADFFLKMNEVSKVTVVCPAFLKTNWETEIKKWSKYPQGYRVFSYERFSNQPPLVKKSEYLVVDEAHYLKNRRAKRTQEVCLSALEAKRVVLLTGTPIGNGSIGDVFTHLLILDPKNKYSSFKEFKSMFIRPLGFHQFAYRNENLFLNELNKHVERKLKTECLDLPPKVYKVLTTKGTKTDKSLHVLHRLKADEGYPFQLKDPETGEIISTVSSSSGKPSALLDYIESLGKSQIVIFCAFVETADFLKKLLYSNRIFTCAIYSGEMSLKTRDTLLSDFRFGKIRILIATIQSLSVGVTLTNCQEVIYYSRTFSITDRAQSEDRFHRIGQHNPVTYLDLVADGFDAYAFKMLSEKQNYDEITKNLQNYEG